MPPLPRPRASNSDAAAVFPDVEAILLAWHERQVHHHLHLLVDVRDRARQTADAANSRPCSTSASSAAAPQQRRADPACIRASECRRTATPATSSSARSWLRRAQRRLGRRLARELSTYPRRGYELLAIPVEEPRMHRLRDGHCSLASVLATKEDHKVCRSSWKLRAAVLQPRRMALRPWQVRGGSPRTGGQNRHEEGLDHVGPPRPGAPLRACPGACAGGARRARRRREGRAAGAQRRRRAGRVARDHGGRGRRGRRPEGPPHPRARRDPSWP